MLDRLDKRWIDFGAAVVGGLVISYYSQSVISFVKPMWSTSSDFLLTAIYVSSYVAAALVVLRWRNKLTINLGWALIAVMGAALCAVADELFGRVAPDDAFSEVFMLPIGVVIYSFLTLPAMALVHYLALIFISNHTELE